MAMNLQRNMFAGASLLLVFVVALPIVGSQALPAVPGTSLRYVDHFNHPSKFHWTKFEEPVNACANTDDAGAVLHVTDHNRRNRGAQGSLLVASNAKQLTGSNHVLAQRRLADVGIGGIVWYRAWFYVDTDILPMTQTGPEMSLQNTRAVGLDDAGNQIYRTMIGGIQYVGNKFITGPRWRIWTVSGEGPDPESETAEWQPLEGPLLNQTGWWKLRMGVNFDKDRYQGAVRLVNPQGELSSFEVRTYKVAREKKFSTGNFEATLEAQNLYDCDNVNVHNAYYDDVLVVQKAPAVVPVAPSLELQESTVYTGEEGELAVGENMVIYILEAPAKGVLDITGGTLTYTATEPTSVGIKYRACDLSNFLCDENWWAIGVPNRAPVGTNSNIELPCETTEITIDSPVVDPDNNIDWESATISSPPNLGTATVAADVDRFHFQVPNALTGSGDIGFQVTVCDVEPWNWCGSAWIVVQWNCPAN